MLGPPKPHRLDQPIAVSLEALVPHDHVYRRLEAKGFVRDRVRELYAGGYHATEPYAKAMRKRKVWVEPLFAEARDWHGLRRARLRGAEKVNIQAQLIAADQNLKRLLSRWGWGRRPWPSGAAGVVLPAAPPATVSPG